MTSVFSFSPDTLSKYRQLSNLLLSSDGVRDLLISASNSIQMIQRAVKSKAIETEEWQENLLVVMLTILVAKNDVNSDVDDCSLVEHEKQSFVKASLLLIYDFSCGFMKEPLSTRELISVESKSNYFYENFHFSYFVAKKVPSYLANQINEASRNEKNRSSQLNELAIILAGIASSKHYLLFEDILQGNEKFSYTQTSKKTLLDCVAENDLESQFQLGTRYFNQGKYSDAIRWFRQSADLGHVSSQNYLGKIFFDGTGGFVCLATSLKWLNIATINGHPESLVMLNRILNKYNIYVEPERPKEVKLNPFYVANVCAALIKLADELSHDTELVFKILTQASLYGESESSYLLGRCYVFGNGTPVNYKSAINYLEKAADKGHLDAIYLMGYCNYFGDAHIDKDDEKALENFKFAANLNHPKASYFVGDYYLNGRSTPINIDLAISYFKIATDSQPMSYSGNAYYDLGFCYLKKEKFELAYQCFSHAVDLGYEGAKYRLAVCLYYGVGTVSDKQKAFLICDSLNEKSASVCLIIADCYERGEVFTANEFQSNKYRNLISEKALYEEDNEMNLFHMEVHRDLCLSYHKKLEEELRGQFLETKLKVDTAAELFFTSTSSEASLAADLFFDQQEDFPLAKYMLGLCYYYGKGTVVDLAYALVLINNAAKNGVDKAITFLKENELEIKPLLTEDAEQNFGVDKILVSYIYPNEASHQATGNLVDDGLCLGEGYNELINLIGLSGVKSRIYSLINEVRMRKEKEKRGLTASKERSYHMVFSGNPGTGKTIVARLVADIFYELGITKENKLIECDRSDLVADYVGQTATKTGKVIDSALGGVLFIDEAYSLKGQGGDFGKEAIEILLKRMEDERDNLIVIAAGYSVEMEEMIAMNPGLESRFTRTIPFDDYSSDELSEIFKKLCRDNDLILDSGVPDLLVNTLDLLKVNKPNNFANAREVRNLFERVVQNQEDRICGQHTYLSELDSEYLQTITAQDLNC